MSLLIHSLFFDLSNKQPFSSVTPESLPMIIVVPEEGDAKCDFGSQPVTDVVGAFIIEGRYSNNIVSAE